MADGAAIPQWVLIQKKTFTKWMNGHLKKKQHPEIGDAQNDFDTGTNLMNLVNALYELDVPKHNRNPKMRAHKLDNCELALKMLAEAKVKTNFLGTMHLVDKDLKMLLGMIWAIILDYQIKGITVDDMSAKEGLLLWCQMKTKGYKDVNVKNFTDSWVDGLGFCALINRFRPDLIDFDELDKANNKENLELAFKIAEEQLGITRLLDVEDMDSPDEKSVMTYLSEYYHKFSAMEKDLALITRVKRFLQLVKTVREIKAFYNGQAPPFLQWLNDSVAWIENMNNYKNDMDHCKHELNKLLDWQGSEKTSKIGEKFTLIGKHHNVQALLKSNNMPEYVCPKGCDPKTIEDLWARLEVAEQKRTQVLKDQLKDHFQKMFKQFDKNNDGLLNMNEFKGVLQALGLDLSDAELQALFAQCSEDGEGVKQLPFDQFLAFMMTFISTVDGPEDIKKGFRWLAGQRDFITTADISKKLSLEKSLHDWTVGGAMPAKQDGHDYVKFTDDAFAGK